MAELVEVTLTDAIATVTMRHGKVNALDLELLHALAAALDAARDAGARALVLTGAGTCFSAGVDLFRVLEGGEAYLAEFLPLLRHTLSSLTFFEAPVVAAVNGHAIAGGFVLLAAADRAVMAEGQGRLGTTELLVGVPFPTIAFELVRLRAGEAQAVELILEGSTFGCDDARARRLVDGLVPAELVVDRARAMAGRLAEMGPAFALTKQQLRHALRERLDTAGDRDRQVDAIWRSTATRTRMRAYVESTLHRRR